VAYPLPPQDEIARLVPQLATDEEPPVILIGDERAAIARSKGSSQNLFQNVR